MKILIISGFLGAGKTTFIKEMVRKSNKYLVILENENGQNNIDSRELSDNGPADLKLLEFMEGCVCCTQKDTFSNTILTISAGINPEYLIVEPTGVGKLSNIIAAIQKVSYENIVLLKPVVVISPRGFYDCMAEYPEIYKDQLSYAHTVVLSKIENESPDVIARVTADILAVNPDAEIITEHYSVKDTDWWNSLLLSDGEVIENVKENNESSEIMTVDVNCAVMGSISELVVFLEDAIRGCFGNMTRAKGVLKAGNEWVRFDVADSLYCIIGEESEEPVTQCVFFGKDIDKAHLYERLGSFESALGIPKDIDVSRLL